MKKPVKIKDILNKSRNIEYVMIHEEKETKCVTMEEIADYEEYDQEFDWFEMSIFLNAFCIEFNM